MRLRRTVRRAENYARYSICRPSFCILIFLFASPILYLYHSGLLFKPTDGEAGAQHNKTIKTHPNKHNGGARPQVGSDNRTHVESFDTDILVYNRVPKCGSIWMTRLLYLLGAGDQNKYKVESPYEPGEKPWLTIPQEKTVVDHLTKAEKPTVYIRHQYFIDFKDHGHERPLYINVIRDPVEKFRSFYYFIRNGNLEGDGADVVMSEKKRLMNIDECVQNKDPECTQPKWQLVPYFCGQDPRCRKKEQWAVDKAKENIEQYYVAVGIVEELQESLKLFEAILPRFFHGAISIQSQGEEKIKNDTFTLNKKSLSEESAAFLREKTSISLEYDLYNFVASRFSEMKSQYGIS